MREGRERTWGINDGWLDGFLCFISLLKSASESGDFPIGFDVADSVLAKERFVRKVFCEKTVKMIDWRIGRHLYLDRHL